MKSNRFLASSIVALFVIAAAPGVFAQDVRYNYDRDADFSKCKTYKWVDNRNVEKSSDLRDRQIKAAIDAELAKKSRFRQRRSLCQLPSSTRPGKTAHWTSICMMWPRSNWCGNALRNRLPRHDQSELLEASV
jgi:hypothetical protein